VTVEAAGGEGAPRERRGSWKVCGGPVRASRSGARKLSWSPAFTP